MLKYTGIKRELITDVNMHQIIENGIRGGICQVIVQYAEGNNEHTNKNFDKNTDQATFINDYDANNLYGSAMCEKLPLHSYSWVNEVSTIDENFVSNYDDGDYEYILEVDVKYPKKLQDFHFDLPFLCVRDTIFKTKKLLFTLEDKYRRYTR